MFYAQQPLEQFNITVLHEIFLLKNLSPVFILTNYNLTIFLLVALLAVSFLVPHITDTLAPSRLVTLNQQIVKFLSNLLGQQVNSNHVYYYFPLFCSLFVLILSGNLLGVLPFGFTITSHICTTLTLSLTTFIGIIVLAVYYNKLDYFQFFVPKGMSGFLKYYLVLIEVFSYVIRPFSLAIRLFANMLAGHTLLKILNTFAVFVASKN